MSYSTGNQGTQAAPTAERETEMSVMCSRLDQAAEDISGALARVDRALDRLQGSKPRDASAEPPRPIPAAALGRLASSLNDLQAMHKFALALAERFESIV